MKSPESSIEDKNFRFDLCQKYLDTMQKNGISSMEGSEAFTHLVLLMRSVNADVVDELFQKYKSKKVLKFLVDALASVKKENIFFKIVENLSKFKNKMFLENYLISLGYNSPTDFLVKDLNEYIGQIDNEDIQETAIYSLCKGRVHLENPKSGKTSLNYGEKETPLKVIYRGFLNLPFLIKMVAGQETADSLFSKIRGKSKSCRETSCQRKMLNCITAMNAEKRYWRNILVQAKQARKQISRELAMKALG